MKELIDKLREHDDARLYEEADLLMSEAADALEAQQAEIERLKATPPDKREDLRCVISDLCQQVRDRDAEIEILRHNLDTEERNHAVEIAARDLVISQLKEAIDSTGSYKTSEVLTAAIALQPSTEALDAYVAQKERERYGEPVGQYVGESDQGDDCIYLYGDQKLRVPTPLYARKD